MDAGLILLVALGGALLANVISSVSSSLSADPVTAQKYKQLLLGIGAFSAAMSVVWGMMQTGTIAGLDNVFTVFFTAYFTGAVGSYMAKPLK
jgi:hypothetical protein